MNTPSASRAERILVWDAPVRVFHWLLVACFAGAWLTAESERWRLVHVTLGYTVGGLVAFRLVWGLVGTRYARFTDFVRGPAAVSGYLRSLLGSGPRHYVGHNPAGAVAIVLLLALAALTVAAGWAADTGAAGHWVEDLHEGLASTMLGVALVHVAAVIAGSALHRENLVLAMLTGRKRGEPRAGIRSAWRSVAALLLAAVAAFWYLQGTAAPGAAMSSHGAVVEAQGD